MQDLVRTGAIVSCHDVSDGGLIVTLVEMAFAGDKGWRVSLDGDHLDAGDLYGALFAEEAGVVVEVGDEDQARAILARHGVTGIELGHVQEAEVELTYGVELVLRDSVRALHAVWEETSYQLERLQQNPACAEQEWLSHRAPAGTTPYHLTFDPDARMGKPGGSAAKPKAAVLREEGTNGDRELAAAFLAAGFETWDVTMTDLMAGAMSLDRFQLLAFPGGFAFADVLDSAKGWASVIRHNERLSAEFAAFFARADTLSLGVCNGCQLMGLLGIPGFELPDALKPRFVKNISERFESRFSTVSISKSPALMLQGMEGSVLGVYVAHGEGRLHVPDQATLDWIVENDLSPVRYVDPQGQATTAYPYNPNGSPLGIAALCSQDGRHLAIMPHPERCYQLRQWPWVPPAWGCTESPWMRMFTNAYAAVAR